MRSARTCSRLSWVVGGAMLTLFASILFMGDRAVSAADPSAKKVMHGEAFKVYQQKCLGCHDSVADPEKPGRTRDEWHLSVKVMHGYGLGLSDQESEMIIDLLYDLRSGIEKEAG